MPLSHPLIYLDNSSASRPAGEAVSKMLTFYSEKWGSPVQPHPVGQAVITPIREALQDIYLLIGASKEDVVIITSSSAESVSQAFLGTYEEVTLKEGKNHFIACAYDDASSLMSLARMEKYGCPVTRLKPNPQGIIAPESLIEVITPRTAFLALSWANGLTGVVQPIEEIAEICQLRGIRLLVDATHVIGKMDFDLKKLPITYLAFNGPQIQGPEGTGGLYIRKGAKTSPLIPGGIEQGGLRGGTVNVPGIVGLGAAAKLALQARDYMCTEVARLKYHFEQSIKQRIPVAQVLFEQDDRMPHISAIAFPGVVNEALLYMISRKGVCAGMGGGSMVQIGYLLEACGFSPLFAQSALTFSLSKETREEELDLAVDALEWAVNKLLKASKEWVHGL